MLHIKRWRLVLIIFLFLSQSAGAQNSKSALVDKLYVRSGMEMQTQQIPLLIQARFDQAVNNDYRIQKLPRHIVSDMREIILQSYAAEHLEKTIKEHLALQMKADEIRDVLTWLDSPLGKKCTQLEEAASTPEAFVKMQAYAGQIQDAPPPQNRLKLFQGLDSAVKATETSVEIAMNTQIAVIMAIVVTLPVENQKPFSEIKKEVEKSRPQLEAVMKAEVLLSFLYTYRSLRDSELEQYLDFTTSTKGEKYHSAAVTGFKKALLDGSIKWGNSIAELLQKSEKQSEI